MISKDIFKKKKKNNFFFYILILIFFILISFIYYNNKVEYFTIPKFSKNFYFFPLDKGGKKIDNLNKKGLHLSYKDEEIINLINKPNIKYSIQVLTNENYENTLLKLDEIILKNLSNISKNDFFIVTSKNNLGNEFFLLYKNFKLRDDAYNFCIENVNFIQNCVIVNVQNL